MTTTHARFTYSLAALVRRTEHELDAQRVAAVGAVERSMAAQRALASRVADASDASAHARKEAEIRTIDTSQAMRRALHLARMLGDVAQAREDAGQADAAAQHARRNVADVHRRLQALHRHRDASHERHRRVAAARRSREADAAWLALSATPATCEPRDSEEVAP